MEERHQVAALTGVYGLTLWVVYRIDDPFLWVGWAAAAVLASGAALIRMNR